MRMRSFQHLLTTASLLGVLSVLNGPLLLGQEQPKAETSPAKKADQKASEEKKEKDKEKSFDDLVKDMESVKGLFTFYRNPEENKVLLEIAPDQFDKDYLYSSSLESGTGERGLYGTLMMDEFVFQFRRMGKRVQFFEKNLRFRAAPGSPAARAVEKSFSDSLISSAEVLGIPHPERGSVLVDLHEILVSKDLHGIGQGLKTTYKTGYKFNKDDSGVVLLKSFPKNSEIGVAANFQASELKGRSVTVPDRRSLILQFRYSLVELRENDYMPRLADDRVGYFMDMYLDYSSDQTETPYVRYINRWKLVKKDPEARVSEPVEPIVFWLENSIPEEYREWIKEGILLWNPAFERAGFKNALAVKQQPDEADWDPADIRYSTIRWMIGYDASFAIGPSHSNPYTGQLLDADIGISEGILRLGARRRYELYVHPVQSMEALKTDAGMNESAFQWGDGRYYCNYAQGLHELASFGHDVMAARPDWNPDKEKEFVRQYTQELLAHEVGHTLGLRHNFRASTINSMSQLSDKNRTGEVGLGASVMDYNPAIIALKGEQQGDYFPTTVGSYDNWVIEYGYKPIDGAKSPQEELPALREIASRAADPLHAYATDEDAGISARALDPRNTRFDFADKPLDWFRHEYKLVNELWNKMETKLQREGDSYSVLRRAFGSTFTHFFRGAHVAMKYIGGIYHNRDHAGDPNGRPPFVPVPASLQREALQFLGKEIWSPDAFQVPASLLNKLQFERFRDFEGRSFRASRLDYPLHDAVANVQGEILDDAYDPIRLSRILDLEMKYEDPNNRFTMADLFVGIRETIWSELQDATEVRSFRRNLQRKHLEHLMRLTLAPAQGIPGDATALARADLHHLKDLIALALKRNLDYTTRVHLEESSDRISQALNAKLERSMWQKN